MFNSFLTFGYEKAPMRCCIGADMLLFAFLINWRNLIQYEYHSKIDNGGYAYKFITFLISLPMDSQSFLRSEALSPFR